MELYYLFYHIGPTPAGDWVNFGKEHLVSLPPTVTATAIAPA